MSVDNIIGGCEYICQWPDGDARCVVVLGRTGKHRLRVTWNECIEVEPPSQHISVRKVISMHESVPEKWLYAIQ